MPPFRNPNDSRVKDIFLSLALDVGRAEQTNWDYMVDQLNGTLGNLVQNVMDPTGSRVKAGDYIVVLGESRKVMTILCLINFSEGRLLSASDGTTNPCSGGGILPYL